MMLIIQDALFGSPLVYTPGEEIPPAQVPSPPPPSEAMVARAKAAVTARNGMKHHTPWTQEEDQYLMTHSHLSYVEMARVLCRTPNAVAARRTLLRRQFNAKRRIQGV